MWHRLRHIGAARTHEASSEEHSPGLTLGTPGQLYASVARRRFDAQTSEIAAIDSKAASMFTIGSAVLPVTTSLQSAARNVVTSAELSKWALVAGAGFYAALVVAFVLAYRLQAWDTRPELAQWQEVTAERKTDEIQRWLGDAYIAAYLANVPQIRRKAAITGASLWLLAGEAASLTVAVLAPLF